MGDVRTRVIPLGHVKHSSAYNAGHGNVETKGTRSKGMLHRREQMVMLTVGTARKPTPI